MSCWPTLEYLTDDKKIKTTYLSKTRGKKIFTLVYRDAINVKLYLI